MVAEALFSSAKEEWATPLHIFKAFNDVFHFQIDVCATKENAKCKRFITKKQDCFKAPWGNGPYWMNPPYGRNIGSFMELVLVRLGGVGIANAPYYYNTAVLLLPARTDTKAFQLYANGAAALFIAGRIHFGDSQAGAPFPSVALAYGTNKHLLQDVDIPGLYVEQLEA